MQCLLVALLPSLLAISPPPHAEIRIKAPERTIMHTFYKSGSPSVTVIAADYDSGPIVRVIEMHSDASTAERRLAISKTRFNQLWASFKASGAERFPWRPDARKFDLEHYYFFVVGLRSYLIPNSQASPTLARVAAELRSFSR